MNEARQKGEMLSDTSDSKIPLSRASAFNFEAASHEDPASPGAFKKVLFAAPQLPSGQLQMINWAKIPAGRAFNPHYHEDMHEIFIVVEGRAEMSAYGEKSILQKGDSILIRPHEVHAMRALDDKDVDYVVFGVSSGQGGKTVNV